MNDESIEQDIRNYDLAKWLFALFLALVLAILLLQGCLSQNASVPELETPDTALVAGEPVTLTGTADAAFDVVVFANSKRIGIADVAEDGRWSLTTQALSRAGDYEITLQAVDEQGNELAMTEDPVLLTLEESTASMSDDSMIESLVDGADADSTETTGSEDLVSAESESDESMADTSEDAEDAMDGEAMSDDGAADAMSEGDMADDSDSMMSDEDSMTDDSMMSDEDSMSDDSMMSDEDSMSDDSMMSDEDSMSDDSMMSDEDSMSDDSMMSDAVESASSSDDGAMVDTSSVVAKVPTIEGVDVTVSGDTTQVVVRGTADPATRLRIYHQENSLGDITSGSDGSWMWSGTAMVNNGDALVVQALNSDGQVIAVSPTYPLIIDNLPAMTDGAAPAEVALRWEDAERNAVVSDGPINLAGRGTPNTEIAILIDTTELTRVWVGGSGDWSYVATLPTLSEGSYTLRAVALDNNGGYTDIEGLLSFTVGADDGSDAVVQTRPTQSVATLALSDSNFSILASALQSLGLADVLDGAGPFTVFAPTNAAFAKWPDGELDLLLRVHPEVLANILQYHVVSGEFDASQVTQAGTLSTLSGDALQISALGDTIAVNRANVVQGDVMASNGVIHAIDTVLLPPFGGAPPAILSTSPSVQADQRTLTVSGTGEPGLKMLVELGGEFFGQGIIGEDGRWSITGIVGEAGTYDVVAFECTYNEILLAVSDPTTVVIE